MRKQYTVITISLILIVLFNQTVVFASTGNIAKSTAPFTCTNSTDIRWIGQWNVYLESTTTVGGYNGWTAGNFSGLRIRGNGTAISIVYIKPDASYVFIDVAADMWSEQILDDTTWLEVITTEEPGEGISVDFCPSDDQPTTCSVTTDLRTLGGNQWNGFWDQTVTTASSEYYGWQSGNYNGFKIRSSGVGIIVTYIEPDEDYVTVTAEGSEWVTIASDTRWIEAYITSVSAPEGVSMTMAPVTENCGDEQKPTGNILIDGDMEQWFKSTGWQQVDFGTIQTADKKLVPYTWDRINTGLSFPQGWSYWWNNGDARCGEGYQSVGKRAPINGDIWNMGKGAGASIEQNFTWLGGTLYWRLSARGKFQRVLPPTPPGKAIVYIDGESNSYFLLNEADLTVDWQTFTGSVELPAGKYRVKLDAWNKDVFLVGTIDDGAVYYDDVYFSYYTVGAACSDQDPEVTPTPNMTGTPGPTMTPTSEIGNWTPTPDGSPTPTDNPEILNIWNCGFEAGRGSWSFNVSSGLGYAGGPTGATHAIASGWWPSVYQNVTTRTTQIYITAWVKGKPYIRLVNRTTGAIVDIYRSDSEISTWTKIQQSVYLPGGAWRLDLNNADQPTGYAYYDGVTMAYGRYATQSESWCSVDPTPGPTSFVTLTPTPTGTLRPSSTPQATNTQIASMTPNNTWTPGPTSTVGATSTPNGSELTATAVQGTATAQGTPAPTSGTGTGSGTVVPGTPVPGAPQQPNGGQGADCKRPSDWWRADWWIDYEFCEGKAFMSWGDGNTQQVKDLYDSLKRYEPFGTINELDQAGKTFQGIVNSYSFGDGLPGQKDHPRANTFYQGYTSPYNNGTIDLTGSGGQSYSTSCALQVEQIIGRKLGQPMCFIFDILRKNNLMPWIQFFVNLASIIALGMYVGRQFIDRAS